MIHEDTKNKSILWDGRVLILSSDSRKIAKSIKLKVGDQVYEIEIAEEEWHSDPDWWLSESDRKNDQESESDCSASWCQNEDPEIDTDMIGVGDDVSSDSAQLMKDMSLNSNVKSVTEEESCNQMETEMDFEGDERYGPPKELGLQRMSPIGSAKRNGLVKSKVYRRRKKMSMEGPNLKAEKLVASSEGPVLNVDKPAASLVLQKPENMVDVSKKQRPIQECYPESIEEIWVKETTWVTPRTRQRQTRRTGVRQTGDDKVCIAGTVSISDGCIENRNKVIQREMNWHEVNRMMKVGERLGFQFDNNEEEIRLKLLEAEERELAGKRDVVEV
ncbi:hypothetical protein SLA2020_211950 [Shorea laevis]